MQHNYNQYAQADSRHDTKNMEPYITLEQSIPILFEAMSHFCLKIHVISPPTSLSCMVSLFIHVRLHDEAGPVAMWMILRFAGRWKRVQTSVPLQREEKKSRISYKRKEYQEAMEYTLTLGLFICLIFLSEAKNIIQYRKIKAIF